MKENTNKKRGYGIRVNDALSLHILPTANAWWNDCTKTRALIDALITGQKIREAYESAGISLAQYKYFVRVHPQVNRIRKMYKSSKAIRGELALAEAKELNPVLAHKIQKLLQKVSSLEETISGRGREIGGLKSSLARANQTIEKQKKRLMPDPDVPMTDAEIAEWQGANYPGFTFDDHENLLSTFHPESARKIREQWVKDKEIYQTSSMGIPLEKLEKAMLALQPTPTIPKSEPVKEVAKIPYFDFEFNKRMKNFKGSNAEWNRLAIEHAKSMENKETY